MKEVKITKKECIGYDEVYAPFFQCPDCKNTQIIKSFMYCPDCGVKLSFTYGAKNIYLEAK